jgi:UDP-glucuronate 4-epimerase
MSKRYLVTGAAGFIGFTTAQALLARGDEVVGFDSVNDYYDPALKEARLALLRPEAAFRFERGDLADRAAVEKVFEEGPYDAVIHLGAQAGVRYSLQNPHAYAASNLTGFLNILEACRAAKTPHLVYASSSSVYGLEEAFPFSEHACASHPVSLYAATKRANELMAHSYAHLYRVPCTGLRFFTVYGPWGRPDMAYFKFAKAIFEGHPIDLYNFGEMERDFTYVDDIVKGILAIAEKPAAPAEGFDPAKPDPALSSAPWRIYNIGNHTPVKLRRFVEILENAIGKKAETNLLPMQPGDVKATAADVEDLARDAGFAPATPLEVGIPRFVAWYRAYYKV